MKRLLLVFSAILSSQPSLVDVPPLARVVDDGRLTLIYGLPGNFLSGPPGPPYTAYSNDGELEWRLEPGLLSATRAGRTAYFATDAATALFRGIFATLPEKGETLQFEGESLAVFAGAPDTRIAGRAIAWDHGRLRIVQPDGSVEEVICPDEPESITAAAADWAHLRIGGRPHLLHLRSSRVRLYVLPRRGPA